MTDSSLVGDRPGDLAQFGPSATGGVDNDAMTGDAAATSEGPDLPSAAGAAWC